MVKPSLLYLLKKDEPEPRLAVWPELGPTVVERSYDRYIENFGMGSTVDIGPTVVSVHVDDADALLYIDECVSGVLVIAMRGNPPFSDDWGLRLDSTATRHSIVVTEFNRHDVAAALGRKAYWDGISSLQVALDYLRGPGVQTSEGSRRTERVLNDAIESLCGSGYRTPKR